MHDRALGHPRQLSRPARGAVNLVVGALCVVAGSVVALVPQAGSSGTTIASSRSRIVQIERRIALDGARVRSFVMRYDRVQAKAAVLKAALAATRVRLAAEHRAEARAAGALRTVAVEAYVSGGGLEAPPLLTRSASTAGMASVYVDVASQRLQSAIDAFQYSRYETRLTAATLAGEVRKQEATMQALLPDQRAAEAAVVADDALLARVQGNLHDLLVLAAARRKQQELAAERAMAAREAAVVAASEAPTATPGSHQSAASATARATAPQPSPALPSSPQASPSAPSPAGPPPAAPSGGSGSYANPLRSVGGLTPERIDQGVDYSGYGPIFALGDGVVLSTVNAGWPGGTFIAYRLSDGPAAGLVVYAAEDIDPLVQVGETVTPSTELGLVYAGPDGIETGWAAPGGLGDTMAAQAGQFSGANSTAFGANFSQLLQALGAPGGILQNPPTGTLPAGWPTW
jgi:hypothetical protein